MKPIRSLDLNALYEKGYDSVFLPRNHYAVLRDLIASTQWELDPDGIFLGVPDWSTKFRSKAMVHKIDQEREHNALMLEHAPEGLLSACKHLLACPSVMGVWLDAYQASLRFVSLWNGAEDLDWHWDGPAQADFFFLIYLNDKQGWPVGGGGELMTGVRPLDVGYLRPNPEQVSVYESIEPQSRTLVCCNNQNPRFVHKVMPLKEAKQRVVLMVGFDLLPTMRGQAQ